MSSVAISIDVCSLLTAGAMEDGGRSNASSSSGGVGYGGCSCPNSTREVLLDNLRAALEASEEKHVAIRGCDRKWPFDLTYRKRSWTSPEAPLVGMRLLVVGSTLGGYVIDFPSSILDKYVVLMLCRMSDIYGKVVEVTVLGEATSAIEWEAGQFVAVFNATVDFEKKKLIIGNDALVCDRTEGFMVSFPESFDDVQW